MEDLARVTIVPNEVAADLLCSFLRAEGIKCAHRVTNVAAGALDGAPGMGGAREILVAESDVEAAEAILAAVDEGAFESEDTPQT